MQIVIDKSACIGFWDAMVVLRLVVVVLLGKFCNVNSQHQVDLADWVQIDSIAEVLFICCPLVVPVAAHGKSIVQVLQSE